MHENILRMSIVYYPFQIFSNGPSVIDIALIILNNGPSLRGLERVITKHWNSFSVHVCADGGSNSLYDNIQEEQRHLYIPNVIIGDLDSARSDVLQYYKSKGSEIIRINDQNSTDFDKALTYLMSQKFTQIYVFNCLWGRFDQVLGNVNTLYSIDTSTVVYLITEDTLIVALKTGDHVIHIKRGLEEGHCGLVPLGGPCSKCWTSGLHWNLDGAEMKFGGLISTCNLLADTPSPEDYTVMIKCTHPLLFTLSHKLCH